MGSSRSKRSPGPAGANRFAFDRRATVLDGNVERVMSRLFAVEEPLPGVKPLLVDAGHNVLEGAASGNLCIAASWPARSRFRRLSANGDAAP